MAGSYADLQKAASVVKEIADVLAPLESEAERHRVMAMVCVKLGHYDHARAFINAAEKAELEEAASDA